MSTSVTYLTRRARLTQVVSVLVYIPQCGPVVVHFLFTVFLRLSLPAYKSLRQRELSATLPILAM